MRAAQAETAEFLVIDGDQVGFDFAQPLDLDLAVVEQALQPQATLTDLQAAVNLVNGQFLAGFSLTKAQPFEEWLSQQRVTWQHNIDLIFQRLTQIHLAAPQPQLALQTASQWLSQAPFSETAYRFLMEAQALGGDRAAALQSYAACRAMVATEFGAEPMAETIALAERIRDLQATGQPPRWPEIGQPSEHETGSPKRSPLPLVGRTEEHRRLVGAYQAARQGQPQTVSISGEAGIGKTRLVEAFLDWLALQSSDFDLLTGKAYEMGGGLPYQPVVDALRLRLEQENAPDDLLADVWLAELSQLLPELRDRYPDLPPLLTGDTAFVRARLFEAIATLGQALAERQPLIVVVDDLQWADEGTLDLLHYLVRRWTERQTRILLLLTIRQEALITNPSLVEWLDQLEKLSVLQRLRLSLLAEADLRQLVTLLAGPETESTAEALAESPREAVAKFAAWLHRKTEGTPFFIEAMLTMLQEQGVVAPEQTRPDHFDIALTWQQIQATHEIPLPPTVRDIILKRVGRLSEPARHLLIAGAVLGRQCAYARLCHVAGLDELGGLTPLEELLESGLLLEGEMQAPYRLSHDNVREIVYTQAGEARRRIYHQRALVSLEASQAPASELAFHAKAGQRFEAAFRYSLAAGDQASLVYATSDAIEHYAVALSLLDDVETSSEERCALCTAYGRALELANDFAAAIEHYQAMQQVAEQREDSALNLAALVGEGTIRALPHGFSDFSLAEALGESALSLAQALDDSASEAKIQWNLMNVYRRTERIDLALNAGQRAITLAESHNLREQLAYTLSDLVNLHFNRNEWGQSLTYGRQAMSLWRDLNNRPMLIESLNSYALQQAFTGKGGGHLCPASSRFFCGLRSVTTGFGRG